MEIAEKLTLGEWIAFETPNTDGTGYYLKPKVVSSTWILVFHDTSGLDEDVIRNADRLFNDMGNVHVLAVDMFDGRGFADFDQIRGNDIVNGAIEFTGEHSKIATLGWHFGAEQSIYAASLSGARAKACVFYTKEHNDVKLSCQYLEIRGQQDDIVYNTSLNFLRSHLEKMDKTFWVNPPLFPSADDVKIFEENVTPGTTLLLGCTKNLLHMSTNQIDSDPWYDNETVIRKNWADNDAFFDNIIGDGVFNFTKDLTDRTLKMCSEKCKTLVVRSFNRKLPVMRVADYFPTSSDFEIKPSKVILLPTTTFYVWKF